MRNIKVVVLAILASVSALKAQDTLFLFQSSGGVVKYDLSKLDSMTFSASQNTNTIDTTKTTLDSLGSITDIDGNVYPTVKIGQQYWTAKDLKTTRFANGDKIATTCPPTLNIANETAPIYQWAYQGLECNTMEYGRLYTWFAAGDTRNVCPSGWHVPTDNEWAELITYLGGTKLVGGTIGGGALKNSTGAYWNTQRSASIDSVGFNSIAGGFRRPEGLFEGRGESVHYWTSTWDTTVNTNNNGYPGVYRAMTNDDDLIYRYSHIPTHGFHVRCIKN